MDKWLLDYWKPADKQNSPVKKDVEKLMKDKVRRQQFTKLVLGVQEFGPEGYIAKGNKYLGDDLYDLRDTSKHTRYYYCATNYNYLVDKNSSNSVLLLVVADDNKDRQQHAIERARQRLSQISECNLLNEELFEIVENAEGDN